MTDLTGHCMCGETTLAVTPAKRDLHACHCGMCRKWTGGPFLAFEVAADDLSHRGPVRRRASSDWAERAWCDSCGAALWYRVTMPGPSRGLYHVAAGLFDAAHGYPLAGELFIDLKPGGYAFAGTHQRFTDAEVMEMFASAPGDEG
ncbi:MAG: GFA family protein [Pseudomonadota bacterium]